MFCGEVSSFVGGAAFSHLLAKLHEARMDGLQALLDGVFGDQNVTRSISSSSAILLTAPRHVVRCPLH